MKTFFKTTILATILMLGITSCISEPILPNPPVDGERIVALRIADSPDPRSTRNTAPIPSGTPLVLNTGNIYLVNADGTIVSHFTIVPADNSITTLTAENLAAGIIHRNLLNTGVMLLNVPGNVTEVVIIGNTPNSNHIGDVDGEFIGGRRLNIITQHNAENVNLFGRRALPPTPTTTNDLTYFPVSVHLSPTVARFELPSITGMGMIESFVVEGIFINNYHREATIGGYIPSINSEPNLINHTGAASFAYNAPGTSYTTASNNALFYRDATGQVFHGNGVNLTVRPSAQQTYVFHPNVGGGSYVMRDHVWGFQLFARNYGESGAPQTEAPRLVIRLNDIYVQGQGRISGHRFVNVGEFYRLQSGTPVPVTHIRAANVYHILHGIAFDETDLARDVDYNEINVEVTVTLAVWDGEDVHQRLRQPNPPAVFGVNAGTGGTLYLGAAHPSVGVTYQWQRLVDDVWTNVDGATGLNLIIPPTTMIVPAYFRRVATLGNERHYSNSVWVYTYLIDVESVTLDIADVVIFVGETQPLVATITPHNAANQSVMWSISDTAIATVNAVGVVTGVAQGMAIITVTTVDGGHTASATIRVEIPPAPYALIGGVRWATRNVNYPNTFAVYPHSAGRFFQWGTIGGVTHHWPATGGVTGWNSSNARVAWTEANQPCPPGWRLPTQAELTVLDNAGSTWHANWNGTGVSGRVFPAGATAEQVTDASPTAIFLPAAGYRHSTTGALSEVGVYGDYWSSTADGTISAQRLWFNDDYIFVYILTRAYGFSVRCVQ